ncbi:unnamed protein product [Pleuronectes platessa]|uniref:CRAL-TRIO domain-containing protein n=1 Tax=Pleuronectes platessa TaxID=8262 RepID=A0A9N7USC2_PLEPL|nr:unnamed protein product [Pleuronectes platessa]
MNPVDGGGEAGPDGLATAGSGQAECVRAADVLTVLREKVAFVSGGRDKRGGPILTFPARTNHDRIKQEDLSRLVTYLATIPSEDVRARGFSVVVDMRGSKWDSVKPVLRTLQETFSSNIHTALLIKPDTFWQKHKTNLGSAKLSFETSLVSVEGLSRLVDPSQLTSDLGGSLEYDHVEWTELRLGLEEFSGAATQLLAQLEQLEAGLNRVPEPGDVDEARKLLEEHNRLRNTIATAPVEALEREGRSLLQRMRLVPSHGDASNEVSGGGCSHGSWLSGGTDFQSVAPKVSSLLERLQAARGLLLQGWSDRKLHLDQVLQMHLFEQDATKMSEWIAHSKDLFMQSLVEVGQNNQHVLDLQTQHQHFTANCLNGSVNVDSVVTVAARLAEAGHYGAERISLVSSRLQEDWKTLTTALEERSNTLAMATGFHQGAEQFLLEVEGRVQACSEGALPSATAELEAATKKHEELNEEISASYTQVPVCLLTCLSAHLSVCPTVCLLTCLSAHLSVCSPVCLSNCLSAHLSVCSPVCLLTCLLTCLPAHLSVCSPVCLSAHLSVCSPVCLLTCLSAHLSVCPTVCLLTCLSAHLSFCPTVCLSNCLSAHLSVCSPVCLLTCLSAHLSVCSPVCLSNCLSAHLSVCSPVCSPVCLLTCLSAHLSVCLLTCLSAHLSVCSPVCLSNCLSAHLSVCSPVCLLTCLPAHLSVCSPVCLLTCLSAHLSVCLLTCLSVCSPVCLLTCLSAHLSVCLLTCLTVHLSVCSPVCLLTCLSAHLSDCSPVCLSAHLFACSPVCLLTYLSAHLSVCSPVCLLTCLPAHLSVCSPV